MPKEELWIKSGDIFTNCPSSYNKSITQIPKGNNFEEKNKQRTR